MSLVKYGVLTFWFLLLVLTLDRIISIFYFFAGLVALRISITVADVVWLFPAKYSVHLFLCLSSNV